MNNDNTENNETQTFDFLGAILNPLTTNTTELDLVEDQTDVRILELMQALVPRQAPTSSPAMLDLLKSDSVTRLELGRMLIMSVLEREGPGKITQFLSEHPFPEKYRATLKGDDSHVAPMQMKFDDAQNVAEMVGLATYLGADSGVNIFSALDKVDLLRELRALNLNPPKVLSPESTLALARIIARNGGFVAHALLESTARAYIPIPSPAEKWVPLLDPNKYLWATKPSKHPRQYNEHIRSVLARVRAIPALKDKTEPRLYAIHARLNLPATSPELKEIQVEFPIRNPRTGEREKKTMKILYPMFGKNNEYPGSIPLVYRPSYYFSNFDPTVMQVLEDVVNVSDVEGIVKSHNTAAKGEFLRNLFHAGAASKSFNNGCVTGQMKRWADGMSQVAAHRRWPAEWTGVGINKAATVLASLKLIKPRPAGLKLHDKFFDTIYQTFRDPKQPTKERTVLSVPNLNAASGEPYPVGTKAYETLHSDLYIAATMIYDLHNCENGTEHYVLGKYRCQFCARKAPKAEVYEGLEFFDKTRNVYLPPRGLNYAILTLVQAPSRHVITFYEDTTSVALSGFNPYRGGMHLFLSQLMRVVDGSAPRNRAFPPHVFFVGVYSDNVFFLMTDPDHPLWQDPENRKLMATGIPRHRRDLLALLNWYSTDGKKQEACQSIHSAQLTATRLQAWWDEYDFPTLMDASIPSTIPAGWAKFLKFFFVEAVTNMQAVLGDNVYTMVQMASGLGNTAWSNDDIMVMGVARWLQRGAPPVVTGEGLNPVTFDCFNEVGVHLTIVRETLNMPLKVLYPVHNTILDLDLLGMSAYGVSPRGFRDPKMELPGGIPAPPFNMTQFESADLDPRFGDRPLYTANQGTFWVASLDIRRCATILFSKSDVDSMLEWAQQHLVEFKKKAKMHAKFAFLEDDNLELQLKEIFKHITMYTKYYSTATLMIAYQGISMLCRHLANLYLDKIRESELGRIMSNEMAVSIREALKEGDPDLKEGLPWASLLAAMITGLPDPSYSHSLQLLILPKMKPEVSKQLLLTGDLLSSLTSESEEQMFDFFAPEPSGTVNTPFVSPTPETAGGFGALSASKFEDEPDVPSSFLPATMKRPSAYQRPKMKLGGEGRVLNPYSAETDPVKAAVTRKSKVFSSKKRPPERRGDG